MKSKNGHDVGKATLKKVLAVMKGTIKALGGVKW